MITAVAKRRLYAKAKRASSRSYSPYSHFPVGAAILTTDGHVYVGVNVENASLGLTICAERAAICNAVAHGATKFAAIAVYSKHGEATPCGACRQFISEFGSEIEVIYGNNGHVTSSMSDSLLPHSFSKEDMTR